ncbi:MAG: nucleotidyltransferase family protein [Clostridia bacterium]|nr:nucleotidyltransferase family protein [Clostridia bacterium]
MKNVTKILFSLIKRGLSGDSAESITKDLSKETLEELYRISDKYDMAQFITVSDSEFSEKFKKKQILALYRHQKSAYALDKISKALNDAGVDFIPLKGAVISKLYPESYLRTSCDIDILVHEKDLDKAIDVLSESLQYKAKGERDYHDISLYSPEGVHLELHFNIRENMANLDKVLDRVWDHSYREDGHLWRMKNEFLIFHTVTHMCYHFTWGGCGIRSFVDLYLMRDKLDYDENVLRAYLKEAEIEKFYDSVISLIEVWLGDKEHSELTQKIEKYIFSGGIYGNNETRIAMQQGKSGGKIGFILSRLFLPLETLKSYYPILNKYPWLYPFMIVRRFMRLITKKAYKNASNELKINGSVSKEKVNETKNFLKELGL